LSVLAERNFVRYTGARLLANFAVQIQTVAIGWQVYARSQDPFDLGLIGLSQFLPFLLFVLPAGQYADRANRTDIVVACHVGQALLALALFAWSAGVPGGVWPVFLILTLFGTLRAFATPATSAILPNLVPAAGLGSAVAINSSMYQFATVAGPAAGGLLYLAGAERAYLVVFALLALAAALVARIRVPVRAQTSAPWQWHTVFEGLRFIRSRPIVIGSISLDLFAVLLGGATALLPIYAADVLHVGPDGLGYLRTAPAAGAALIALALTAFPLRRRVGPFLFGGVALFGIATIAFGLSTSMTVSLAALAVMGAGDMFSVYIRHLLVQLETPDAIRGRVSAVDAVFIGASNELGEFESGLVAAWIGAVPAVVVGGVGTLAVAGLWSAWFPALRRLDRFPRPAR
jgi:MFS family permease